MEREFLALISHRSNFTDYKSYLYEILPLNKKHGFAPKVYRDNNIKLEYGSNGDVSSLID